MIISPIFLRPLFLLVVYSVDRVPDPLDFVPFPDSNPAYVGRGGVVELAIPNREYAEQLAAYRAGLEHNPFAINTAVETLPPTFEDRAEDLIGADELCIDGPRLTLVVGYPFPAQYAVTVESGTSKGFTRADLFRQLVRVYSEMHAGATLSPGPLKLQTHVDSPRFGTAWHRLGELAIEHIVIEKRDDGRTFAWISIGS
jgi:hypothetical protein